MIIIKPATQMSAGAATGCHPWHFFPLPPALSLIELAFSDPYCADLAMSGISAFGETGHRADIGE
jgi:hypothetical protein